MISSIELRFYKNKEKQQLHFLATPPPHPQKGWLFWDANR
jgi:hypothetical protein